MECSIKLPFICCICLLVLSSFLAGQEGIVVRAAIDIGMAGPKLHIAKVDVKTNKIVQTLYTQRYFVNFYDSVAQDADGRLSPDVMEEGLRALQMAIETANSFNPEGVVAIATASFRAAANGIELANDIQKETGIQVHIVDQNLEGILAFQSVLSKIDVDSTKLVVWDVGGGSIQFITQASDGTYLVDCGDEGVGAFTDYIIEHIQKRNRQAIRSPNPMSIQDILQATAHARNLAKRVDKNFKDKIIHLDTIIVGAGPVFGFGIAGLLNKSTFNIEDLAIVVEKLAGKTDADFGGDYAFCEGSNAILVLGYMQALNIKEMHIHNVNNADGALTYQPFWK